MDPAALACVPQCSLTQSPHSYNCETTIYIDGGEHAGGLITYWVGIESLLAEGTLSLTDWLLTKKKKKKKEERVRGTDRALRQGTDGFPLFQTD